MEKDNMKQSNPSRTGPATVDDEHSISTMPQVTSPRQFKFVGAYSRKRRRKKAPPPAAPKEQQQPEAPVTPKSPPVADVSRPRPRPSLRLDNDNQHDKITAARTSPLESMGQLQVPTPSNCQMSLPHPPPHQQPPELDQEQAAMLLRQLSSQLPMRRPLGMEGTSLGVADADINPDGGNCNATMNMGAAAGDPEAINWADSDGGLVHLFQDASADFPFPFDPMNLDIGADVGRYAMPALFPDMALGPFNPFNFGQLQFGGSPSTDSSNPTQPRPADQHDLHQGEGDDDYEHGPREDAGEDDMSMYPSMPDDITLAPLETHPATQSGISHTISQLLTRYDEEFCVLPLTHDFEANPFRFDPKTGRGSQLLLHCILAVSYKHIGRDTGAYQREAKTHKRTAFRMLKDVEGEMSQGPVRANFLDALLILMTLDCATSARGPWTWYLRRAHKMIQATKSVASNQEASPRMQARIEMLVWWDVTLALTTRRGCVLSEDTVLSLLGPDGSSAEASFYSVSGCPRDLFVHMVRLASYAREHEVVAGMRCVRFDMTPVLETAKAIRAWQNPRSAGGEQDKEDESEVENDAKDSHYGEDMYHCAEAWRWALLVYIERVFRTDRGGGGAVKASVDGATAAPVHAARDRQAVLDLLARRTLNHVASCRRSSMLQKQLLLPVFLGGCETKDPDLRAQARAYCVWWNEKSRYDMFLTAGGLLEELWAAEGDPRVWWGPMMDQKANEGGGAAVSKQYLFG